MLWIGGMEPTLLLGLGLVSNLLIKTSNTPYTFGEGTHALPFASKFVDRVLKASKKCPSSRRSKPHFRLINRLQITHSQPLAPGRARTCNPVIRSHILYPIELRVPGFKNYTIGQKRKSANGSAHRRRRTPEWERRNKNNEPTPSFSRRPSVGK